MKKYLIFLLYLLGCTASKQTEPAVPTLEKKVPVVEDKMPTTVAPSGSQVTGTVKGTVEYTGVVVNEPPIRMSADQKCAKANEGKVVLSEKIVVGPQKGLANVFVYIKEGIKETNFPVPGAVVTLDQNGCRYIPHVIGIQAGQTLRIINSDSTMHNIHSVSKTNPSFNHAMPNFSQVIDKKFAKVETLLRIKCDVHTWMDAYINIVDHPYFAVTKADGTFEIGPLPEGEYVLEALHEKLGAKMQNIHVDAKGSATSLSFKF